MSYFNTLPAEAFDAIGVAGFGLYVINYMLLTFERLSSTQVRFFVMNLFAASLVLVSLFATFNLASAMIQIFWIAISITAIVLRIRKTRSLHGAAA